MSNYRNIFIAMSQYCVWKCLVWRGPKNAEILVIRCGIFETETSLFHAVFVSKIAI